MKYSSTCKNITPAGSPRSINCVVVRPTSAPKRSALNIDEDDEDAPAVVDDIDLTIEDNADVQHGSLRAAFPMAFGNGQP